MFKTAYGFDDETIFYFDTIGNKYVAQGGNLAWRINNPGLIRSHSHFAKNNESIGSYKGFSIFPTPESGRKALFEFLKSKKYWNSSLKEIAKHYQPNEPEKFLLQLLSYFPLPSNKKICHLTKQQFDALLLGIEKICGYFHTGNETFTLLQRIYAHFENSDPPYDTYMVADGIILSKEEVIKKILSHRLDATIVHQKDGSTYIRSRPTYSMWSMHMPEKLAPSIDGKIDTITRAVGKKKWTMYMGIYQWCLQRKNRCPRVCYANLQCCKWRSSFIYAKRYDSL